MAKYYITHECGHEQCHQLIGPGRDRDRRLEWLATTLCSDCYQADLAKKRAEATETAQKEATEQELPELTGTEKQSAWAVRIRSEHLNASSERVEASAATPETKMAFMDWLLGQTAASWWIDKRDESALSLMTEFAKFHKKSAIDKTDETAVKAEATIRPENPSIEIPTEIKVRGNQVGVFLPVKNDKLREILKSEHYIWDDGWRRAYNLVKTDITDRAAEIASKLLAAGFVVQILDTAIREKVISGNYASEITRWITMLTGGTHYQTHAGWFSISWGRNEDFYQAARKIAGSRYVKPCVVVPPSNYDEVLDFAQMYDFNLTAGAESIVAAQKEIRASALVVSPKIKRAAKVTQMETPPALDVQESEALDEFKD